MYGDDCGTDLRVDWVHLPQGTRGAKNLWDAELFDSLMENIERSQAITAVGAGSGDFEKRCKSPYVESVNGRVFRIPTIYPTTFTRCTGTQH